MRPSFGPPLPRLEQRDALRRAAACDKAARGSAEERCAAGSSLFRISTCTGTVQKFVSARVAAARVSARFEHSVAGEGFPQRAVDSKRARAMLHASTQRLATGKAPA